MADFLEILNSEENNKAEAQKELLHILETAEEDVEAGNVKPLKDTFSNLRKMLNY